MFPFSNDHTRRLVLHDMKILHAHKKPIRSKRLKIVLTVGAVLLMLGSIIATDRIQLRDHSVEIIAVEENTPPSDTGDQIHKTLQTQAPDTTPHAESEAALEKPNPVVVPPSSPVPKPSEDEPPVELTTPISLSNDSMHQAVNNYRKSQGIGVLAVNTTLQAAATAKCIDMSERDYFDHETPDGKSPWSFVDAQGLTSYTSIAENIATGPKTAEGVLELWQNSRGHNANMLTPHFNAAGYGVCADKHDRSLIVQILAEL